MSHPIRRALLGALAAVSLTAGAALAQPREAPIRLIVGFPPGGGIDLLTRVMGQELQARLNRPVVVENRTGAGGNIAAEAVARAPADGSVLGAIPAGPLVINRHIYRTMPYDPLADFTPISRFAAIPVVILANNDFPPRNIAEFAEWLRAGRPAACGTPGAGTTQHLTDMLLLRALGNLDCTIVHYRGTGPALPDLFTNKIQVYTDTVVTGLPPVRDGRARALAIASRSRSALAPEIPTVAETIPGFEADTWLALMGPRGMPDALVAQLEAAAIAMARDPAVVARLRELGAEAVGSTRAELAELIRRQDAQWGPVARAANVTAD
ncbi:Bug family tripartite tricarboxylate transporter substrate binding protein [Falsiroseomonas oryzae]|uniref:Bug family tripartite tricarboxylate transporter substrate binding protein n=1 Tax=Falsiroseomonas oryzae TaxID=2766473 RepID=UPI0022EA46C5|nr:tripartite tricarboxylate transporter substrate binding protein [Roseomonas sp. MO-31]